MGFSITELVGNQVLIEGTDVRGNTGQVVLVPLQWTEIKKRREIEDAHENFDAKVEEFFAELTDAAAILEEAHRVQLDPLLFIVESEGSAGVAPAREVVTQLDHDSVIVRAIETGQDDRVIWVGGSLTLLAQPATAPVSQAELDAEIADAVKGVADSE
jgi:hypothetical protein